GCFFLSDLRRPTSTGQSMHRCCGQWQQHSPTPPPCTSAAIAPASLHHPYPPRSTTPACPKTPEYACGNQTSTNENRDIANQSSGVARSIKPHGMIQGPYAGYKRPSLLTGF